jgi:uncharacterized protein
MTGTWINALAILAGGILGLLVHQRIPKRFTDMVFQAIGLFTLFLGIYLGFKTNNLLILVFSLLLGGLSGELLRIEFRLDKWLDHFQLRWIKKENRFTEGLVTAFLLFCIGSMTILGAIEEGMGNEPNLLITKSIMDGFSAIALASALGIGVLFSIIPLILYQGSLTILSSFAGDFFSEAIINELTACGGILLLGLGLKILEIKSIQVINLLPSLIFAVVLTYFFG